MLLPIKTQGFPQIIEQLGIQPPLVGPFWGFESTVIPTYLVGSSGILATSLPPFKLIDSDTKGVIVNPQTIDTLAFIGDGGVPGPNRLQRGFYAYRFNYSFVNTGVAGTNYIQLQFWDSTGTVARDNTRVVMTGGTTVPPAQGEGFVDGVIEIKEEGDYGRFSMVNNSVVTMAVYLKVQFKFLGLEFLP